MVDALDVSFSSSGFQRSDSTYEPLKNINFARTCNKTLQKKMDNNNRIGQPF